MALRVIQTGFNGLLIIEPKVHEDARGYFMESYNNRSFVEAGIDVEFVQDNQSRSSYGVIRGLHFQVAPYAQTKLVRVLTGTILDVVVDLRQNEPTFSKSFSVELSGENRKQLLVPKGFAHGFAVKSKTAEVFYKCDQYYSPGYERGINYADPELMIDWQLSPADIIVSDKDKLLPRLSKSTYSFEAV
jgi:dTDP-4-dehydrorhamnose 3,5-epimerase